MLRSHLCIAWTLALLCGCSASIPVTHMKGGKTPEKGEGVLLTLPRTVLTLNYSVSAKTFSAGEWTQEIEACEDAVAKWSKAETAAQDACAYPEDATSTPCGNTPVDRKKARDNAVAARHLIPPTCAKAQELGLSSRRLSRSSSALACPNDGGNDEFRSMFDKDSFAVTASGETDPKHVYWVSTPVRTFGDAQVDVSYTERGVVSGAKVTSSNPFLGFAVDVAGIAVRSALSGFGGGATDKSVAELMSPSASNSPRPCFTLNVTSCEVYAKALIEFEALLKEKLDKAATASAGNYDAHLKLIDAGIETQRQAFTGSVDIKPSPKTLRWLPPDADTADKGCGTTELGASEYQGRCSTITIPACRVTDGVIAAAKKPVYRLTFQARTTKVSEEWLAVAKATLVDTNESADNDVAVDLGNDKCKKGMDEDKSEVRDGATVSVADGSDNDRSNYGRRDDRGFPYRVPAIAEVTVTTTRHVDKDVECDKGTASGAMIPAQLAIAQYGLVGRLTPRAGGRKGTVEAKYFETGALQSVSVVREGQDPAPILDPIKEALQPKSSPSELDLLKAQKDYLEAQKAICVAAASLNTTPPDFCKLTGE
jgi:hypothetical protein